MRLVLLISAYLAVGAAACPIFVNAIEPAQLRGDLSFLASDALQGRYTPSPGLDVAAEFIASRFRAIGLEPAGGNDYFQEASLVDRADGRLVEQSAGPGDTVIHARNVAGVLRGRDPNLKRQVLIVSAHYDHIGTAKTAGEEAVGKPTRTDRIYNGANDDGSGTVSLIAIAAALSRLHPQRTILFLAVFGEERGLIGSNYYCKHPLFPLSETIADINLEQLGRTDEVEDRKIVPRLNTIKLTGFQYTNLWEFFERAGRRTSTQVLDDPKQSEEFFLRSDNEAFSKLGIPSTTVVTAFNFPDYHAVGDEWRKIDYQNMARVDRVLALAILDLADTAAAPVWNSANRKTEDFRAAQRALTAGK